MHWIWRIKYFQQYCLWHRNTLRTAIKALFLWYFYIPVFHWIPSELHLNNIHFSLLMSSRRVWRYQRSKQNPYIEEEQTTQWSSEKVQKDKQLSTKHTYKTKERITQTPLKTGGQLRCSGRVGSSCSTRDTRRVNLVTNPVISHEWGKEREVFATSGTYQWSFMTQLLC